MADWAHVSEGLHAIAAAIDGVADRLAEDPADQARVEAAVEELHTLAQRLHTMAQQQPSTPPPQEGTPSEQPPAPPSAS